MLYNIRLCEKLDVPAVCTMIDATLGEGHMTVEELLTLNSSATFQSWVADVYGEVSAFGGAYVAEDNEIEKLLKYTPEIADYKKIGMFTTLATLPAARGLGVGTAITEKRLNWLFNKQNVDLVVAKSWVHDGPTSEGLLAKAGFRSAAIVPGLWEEHHNENALCVLCGAVCSCVGNIMLLSKK